MTKRRLAWVCSLARVRYGILSEDLSTKPSGWTNVLTVCHVRPTAAFHVIADLVCSGQTKVGKLDDNSFPVVLVAIFIVSCTSEFVGIAADKVLRLDVAMADTDIVAESDSLTHLTKHGSNQFETSCAEQGIGGIRRQQAWSRWRSSMTNVSTMMIVRQVTL